MSCSTPFGLEHADRPIQWPGLARDEPEALAWRAERIHLRLQQHAAFEDVLAGFAVAIRAGALVLHRDGDFDVLARHTALRIDAQSGR